MRPTQPSRLSSAPVVLRLSPSLRLTPARRQRRSARGGQALLLEHVLLRHLECRLERCGLLGAVLASERAGEHAGEGRKDPARRWGRRATVQQQSLSTLFARAWFLPKSDVCHGSIVLPGAACSPPAPMLHSNDSMYTLHTVVEQDDDSTHSSPLLDGDRPTYGATTPSQHPHSSGRLIFNATLKMACIFLVSTLLLGGTLWLALPTLEECVLLAAAHRLILISTTGRTDRCCAYPSRLPSCKT